MMLDRLMVGFVMSIPFVVTVGCVRSKAYVHPRVSDDVVIIVIFKGCIIYFIRYERTKNGILFCELHQ